MSPIFLQYSSLALALASASANARGGGILVLHLHFHDINKLVVQIGDHILHLNLTGSYVINGKTMKVVAGICDLTVIRLF